nr:MAG TPA: hypothetical protein [Caudoviricetes sp.]
MDSCFRVTYKGGYSTLEYLKHLLTNRQALGIIA